MATATIKIPDARAGEQMAQLNTKEAQNEVLGLSGSGTYVIDEYSISQALKLGEIRMDSAENPNPSGFRAMVGDPKGFERFFETRFDSFGIEVSNLSVLRERFIRLIEDVTKRPIPPHPVLDAYSNFRNDAWFPFGFDEYVKLISRPTGRMVQHDLQSDAPLNRASQSNIRVSTRMIVGAISYGWSQKELYNASAVNLSLQDGGMEASRVSALDWHQQALLYGYPLQGIMGLFTNPNIGTFNPADVAAGGSNYILATAGEFRTLFNNWLKGMIEDSRWTFVPDTLHLPGKIINRMTQLTVSFEDPAGNGITGKKLLQVLFGNYTYDKDANVYTFGGDRSDADCPWIDKIYVDHNLDEVDFDGADVTDSSSAGIGMAFCHRADVAGFGVPFEFNEMQLFQEGPFRWIVPVIAARTGLQIYQHDAIRKVIF